MILTQTRSGMDSAEQMQDYRRDFDAINEKFEKLLNNSDSLHQAVQNLDRRLADVEEKQEVNIRSSDTRLKYSNSQGAEFAQGRNTSCKTSRVHELDSISQVTRDPLDHSPELLPEDFTTVECQEDYQAIKDSVQRIKLPANLKLNESKQGIRRDDQQTLSVIARTARYTETTLKLLSTYDENNSRKEDTEQILTNIIKVQQAQICTTFKMSTQV